MDQHDVSQSCLPGLACEELRHPIGSGERPLHDDLRAELSGHRLLIVDDDRDSAELLAELLQRDGYVVRTGFDGPTALTVAADFAPHAALLDIGLPVMNGYEVARSLRTIPGLANMKLVAVTGYGRPSDERRAREAGFDAHVLKPYHVSTLGPMLRRLLRGESPPLAEGEIPRPE